VDDVAATSRYWVRRFTKLNAIAAVLMNFGQRQILDNFLNQVPAEGRYLTCRAMTMRRRSVLVRGRIRERSTNDQQWDSKADEDASARLAAAASKREPTALPRKRNNRAGRRMIGPTRGL